MLTFLERQSIDKISFFSKKGYVRNKFRDSRQARCHLINVIHKMVIHKKKADNDGTQTLNHLNKLEDRSFREFVQGGSYQTFEEEALHRLSN